MKYPDLGDLIKVSLSLIGDMAEQLYVVRNWSTEEFLGCVYHVEPFGEDLCYQGEMKFVPQCWFDRGWATIVEPTGENKETESLVGQIVRSDNFSESFLPLGYYQITGQTEVADFTGTYVCYTLLDEDGVEYKATSRWIENGLIEIVEDRIGRIIRVLDTGNTNLFGEYYEVVEYEKNGVWGAREVGEKDIGLAVVETWFDLGYIEMLEGDED